MGNTLIKVSCTDQVLSVTTNPTIASGGVGEDVIEFEFCSLWDGFTKTAVFYRDENTVYHSLLDSDDKVTIPQEVLRNEGTFYFGVFGVSGSVTRTSEMLRYTVAKGAITVGTTPPSPSQSVYEQILALLGNVETQLEAI